MRNEETVFFDNTDDYSKYDNAKRAVYESYYESQDWTSIDEVPSGMIWEEIAAQNEAGLGIFYLRVETGNSKALFPYYGNVRQMERPLLLRQLYHGLERFPLFYSTPRYCKNIRAERTFICGRLSSRRTRLLRTQTPYG